LSVDALILDSLDRFLERAVKPQVHALEAEDAWPAAIIAEMQALGLAWGSTPPPLPSGSSGCRR
jgi:hypothetical protein